MPSGGTGLSKVGAFVVLQGAVGFEAFELGITETSGNWSGVVWLCIEIIVLNIAAVTAVWYSFAQFLKQWWVPSNCATILLNSDHATLLAHDSLWSRIIIYSRTFRRFERSPSNTLSPTLTSQGLTSGHLLSVWVLILSFCDESCLRAISATGLALLTCGSLLREADSYPVAI